MAALSTHDDEIITNIRLLAVNDVYTFRDQKGVGGYSTLKSLVNQHRTDHSLFMINGDVLGGSQLAEVFKGESVVAVLNALSPDIVAIGNHEFDYGPDRLEELMEMSQFDWLSTNVRRKSRNNQLLKHVKPFKVFDYFICSRTGDVLDRCEVQIPELEEELTFPINLAEATKVESPAGVLKEAPPSQVPPKLAERLLQGRLGADSNSLQTDNSTYSKDGESVDNAIPPILCVRLGFLGACTVTTPFCSYPGPDVLFEEAPEIMNYVSKRLKAYGCQVIVGLTHLTMSEDVQVADTCGKRIPVILGGHEHTPIVHQTDETIIFKTGQNGNWLGIVDLSIIFKRNATSSTVVPASTHAVMDANMSTTSTSEDGSSRTDCIDSLEEESKTPSPSNHIAPFAVVTSTIPSFALKTNIRQPSDPATEQVISLYEAKLREMEASGPDVTRVLVTLEGGELDTRTSSCRVRSASGAHLVADAMFSFMGPDLADFAIINGGFIRGDTTYPEGSKITLKDVMVEFPFPKRAVLVKIKGSDLKEAIEQQLTSFPKPSGAFPHLSRGCSVHFDPKKEVGERIQNFTINGRDVDPEKEYRVVLTEFVAGGGDGCVAFLRGKRCTLPADKLDRRISAIVVDYLDSQPNQIYSPANEDDRVVNLASR